MSDTTPKEHGMTHYPDSACEAHRDVTTSEPVCIICMSNEIDELEAQRDSFERMLLAACTALGRINEHLGLDPNDGGANPIIEAIDEIKEQRTQLLHHLKGAVQLLRAAGYSMEGTITSPLMKDLAAIEAGEAVQRQTVNQQQAGVYRKFNVSRTDGRDQPGGDRHGAEYFVLDVTHDRFAKPALAAYAAACRDAYPALADDMVRRYGITTAAQRECSCGWHGAQDDCVWCGTIGPLCPKCHETTEAAQQAAQCPNCLGTNRPHALDPGWKGRCECAAQPPAAKEYSWSKDGELYHGRFDSIAEAIGDYLNTYGDDAEEAVHVGEVRLYERGSPASLADDVIEQMNCQACDESGEWAEHWPDLPKDKREQLGLMIQDFVWKHDAPSFFIIENAELFEVAAYRNADAPKGGA